MASKERDSNHKSPEDIYEEDTDDSDAFIDAIEKQPRGDEFSTGAGGGAAGKAADDDRFQDANEGPDDDKEKEDGNGDDEEEDEVTDELAERRAREEELTENQREDRRGQAVALKVEGNEFFNREKHDEANRKYSEALELCPLVYKKERAVFFANRAAAKCKMGTRESALEDCSSAIELNPNYVKALFRRAQIYEQLDRPHEAIKDFNRVLELDKGHVEANRAVLRLPEKIARKDEELKQEMLGNLKKLGNMVLNPFGLSTDNFQFQQDPSTGNYTVNFKQQGNSAPPNASNSK